MRDFGVDVFKDCAEARRVCFFSQDAQGMINFALAYLKAGLVSDEFCLCLISRPLNKGRFTRALQSDSAFFDAYLVKKQLEIIEYSVWRHDIMPFSPDRFMSFFVRKESEATKAGFKGLRLFRSLDRFACQDNKVFMEDAARWQEMAQNHRMVFADVYPLKLFSSDEITRIISCYPCASRQSDHLQERVKSECFSALVAEREDFKKEMDFVLDVTKTGLDIIDSDFNIHYINPSWAKVYGDYKGKKCYEYFMGNSAVCHGCGLKKAFETKQPVVTREVLAREGNRLVEVTSIPFQDENGKWLVAEVNLDITERLTIEKKLEENRAYSELIFNLVPSAIFTIDLENRIVKWNKKAQDLTGYSAQEAIGQKCFLFAESPCNEKCGVYADDVAKPILNKECSVRRKDGKIRIISKNADLLRDKDGCVIGAIESFEDITERKRMEEELKRVADEWNKTFNAISDAIFMINKDAFIVKFNKAFSDMTRMRREEIVGREYSALLSVDRHLWPFCLAQTPEAKKTPLVIEADRTVIGAPLLVSISSIFDERDQFAGAIHVIRDISMLKQAQDELKDRLRELEIFQEAAVDREIKMVELKQKVKDLKKKLEDKPDSGLTES